MKQLGLFTMINLFCFAGEASATGDDFSVFRFGAKVPIHIITIETEHTQVPVEYSPEPVSALVAGTKVFSYDLDVEIPRLILCCAWVD